MIYLHAQKRVLEELASGNNAVSTVSERSSFPVQASSQPCPSNTCTRVTVDYELGYSLPMTDRSQRVIAALEVEAAMTEAHAKRLSNVAPNLADPGRQREIAALVEEETERAKTIRERIRLLRGQSEEFGRDFKT